MKVALTGHRPQRLGLPEDETDEKWSRITDWICLQLIRMAEVAILSNTYIDMYCGMTSGCDMVFGFVSSVIKNGTEHLRLHCVLPCKNYNSSNKYYRYIKDQSDEWVELAEEFYRGCDNVRDQYMVNHCDVLLAIWDGNKSGGVWSAIHKAQKAGKKIIYCPKDILCGE